ncbi:unnamed protein product [Closterium sp. NIES-65]|nr:unnamed protein product [Closterium sp. NIES-65]
MRWDYMTLCRLTRWHLILSRSALPLLRTPYFASTPRRRLSPPIRHRLNVLFPHAVASPLSPRRRLSSFPTPSLFLFPHTVASPLSPTPSLLLFPHAVASPLSPTPSLLLFPHAVRLSSFPTPSPLLFPHAVASPLSPRRRLSSFPTPSPLLFPPRRRLSSFPHTVASPLSPRRRLSSFPTPSPLLFPPRRRLSSFPHAVASPLSPHAVASPLSPRRRLFFLSCRRLSPLEQMPSFPRFIFRSDSPVVLSHPLFTLQLTQATRHIPIEQASSPSIIFFTSLSEAISTCRFLYSSTLLLTIVHPSHHCIPPCGAMEGGAAAAAAAPASSTAFSLPRFYDYPPYFTVRAWRGGEGRWVGQAGHNARVLVNVEREKQRDEAGGGLGGGGRRQGVNGGNGCRGGGDMGLGDGSLLVYENGGMGRTFTLRYLATIAPPPPLLSYALLKRLPYRLQGKLTFEARQVFLEALVAEGRAEWTDRSRTRCLILWKSINDWADTLLQFVRPPPPPPSHVVRASNGTAGDVNKGGVI